MRTGKWPLAKRLSFYSRDDVSGCRLWTGCIGTRGYGKLKYNGKPTDTHRLAWIAEHGSIPAGLCICHKCDVPACININHLFLGTNQDNDDDKVAKGRQSKGRKHSEKRRGENHLLAKLSFEKVFEMRWLEAMGRTHQSLADEYGVSLATATSAIRGKTWQFECHD